MVLPSDRERKQDRVPSPFGKGGLLDDLFQDLEKGFLGNNSLGRFGNTDIYEKDGTLHYEIELPGLTKDQIDIKAKNDQLIISGKVEKEEREEEANYISRGRRYGRFKQSFGLPEEIKDSDQLKAKFENGVLHIQAELSESLTEENVVDVEIE